MSAKRMRVVTRAHGKVNLDLRVLGNRADGYHELRTVFQTIELHDTLICANRAGGFAVKCRTPGVPLDDSNLVWKAAARLWTALGRPGDPIDTVVTIEKVIPVQSGLGGGSADAAAALQGLARLWGGAPLSLLREVASGLGADVPFFLSGGTALGLGRGEEIYPLVDLPSHAVVIVRPPFGVSTAEAYAWYDEDRAEGAARAPDAAGAVADARGADDQRPRASGGAPAPGDRRPAGPAARGGRGRRGDERQRLGRVRAVQEPRGGVEGRSAGFPRRRPGRVDPHPEPGRTRAEVAGDCPPGGGPRLTIGLPGVPELTATLGSVYTYRFAVVHAGRA